MNCNSIIFSGHAISQMFSRNISLAEVESVLKNGEVIKNYLDDLPYPSYLMLWFVSKRPIHLVTSKDENNNCIIITAYEPKKEIWETDFKTKRNVI